jgi:hypothetical protein
MHLTRHFPASRNESPSGVNRASAPSVTISSCVLLGGITHGTGPEMTFGVTLWAMTTVAANAQSDLPVASDHEKPAGPVPGQPPRSFADWLADNIAALK